MAIPKYTSTVRLFVSTPASALDLSSLSLGSSFTQQRVKSYADIINSPITLNPVIQKLGLKQSAHELAGAISADAPMDTVLIDVNVETPDPILSANIANADCLKDAMQMNEQIQHYGSLSTTNAALIDNIQHVQPAANNMCEADGYHSSIHQGRLSWAKGDWGNTLRCEQV